MAFIIKQNALLIIPVNKKWDCGAGVAVTAVVSNAHPGTGDDSRVFGPHADIWGNCVAALFNTGF